MADTQIENINIYSSNNSNDELEIVIPYTITYTAENNDNIINCSNTLNQFLNDNNITDINPEEIINNIYYYNDNHHTSDTDLKNDAIINNTNIVRNDKFLFIEWEGKFQLFELFNYPLTYNSNNLSQISTLYNIEFKKDITITICKAPEETVDIFMPIFLTKTS